MVGTLKPYLLFKKIELFALSDNRDAKTSDTSHCAQEGTLGFVPNKPPSGISSTLFVYCELIETKVLLLIETGNIFYFNNIGAFEVHSLA